MRLCVLLTPFCAGELPKELSNLVNLTKLLLRGNQFRGELYVPTYTRCMLCSNVHFFAGELPKELGQLTNLTFFDVADNSIGGELYVLA